MGGTYRKFGQGLSFRWLVLLVVFALLIGFLLGKKTQAKPALSPLPVENPKAFNDSYEKKHGIRLLKESNSQTFEPAYRSFEDFGLESNKDWALHVCSSVRSGKMIIHSKTLPLVKAYCDRTFPQ